MRLIDADALIDDLKHDVAADQDSLDYEELTDSNREIIQFDKDCKQNAIDLLQNAPTIEPQRWIPCSERLPKPDEEVFVYLWDNVPFLASMNGEGRWATEHFYLDVEDAPKAWMPLPEPYREDGA